MPVIHCRSCSRLTTYSNQNAGKLHKKNCCQDDALQPLVIPRNLSTQITENQARVELKRSTPKRIQLWLDGEMELVNPTISSDEDEDVEVTIANFKKGSLGGAANGTNGYDGSSSSDNDTPEPPKSAKSKAKKPGRKLSRTPMKVLPIKRRRDSYESDETNSSLSINASCIKKPVIKAIRLEDEHSGFKDLYNRVNGHAEQEASDQSNDNDSMETTEESSKPIEVDLTQDDSGDNEADAGEESDQKSSRSSEKENGTGNNKSPVERSLPSAVRGRKAKRGRKRKWKKTY